MQFRFKALAKQREPDELDTPTILTSARGWVTLVALAAVTGGALAWAAFGRLPLTVSVTGLLTPPNGAAQVQSQYAGLVLGVQAKDGGQISAGQDLAVVRDAQGTSHEVVSLFAGQVISVDVSEGEVIGVGSTVVTIERGSPGSPLVAMLFVSASHSAGIAVGENVGLSVESAPAAQFGLLRGQVLSVSQFPLTETEVDALFGGIIPDGTLATYGGEILVTVRLREDSKTPSGYAWTTVAGPPQAVPPLTTATGTITLSQLSPITLLFHK
jgi:biotin carboxyl carrier protein